MVLLVSSDFWKGPLGSTFDLEVAFDMSQIKRINERNPYRYWILKKFSIDWEYLQQMESESTAIFNFTD